MTEYPESDKLRSFREERSAINGFVDWLNSHGMQICELDEEGRGLYWPVRKRTDDLVMQFFEIDQDKLEHERQAMLDALRTESESADERRCDHSKDMYAPHCTVIDCPNYAGRFVY